MATVSTGTASVTGTAGAIIPQGAQLVDASGVQLVSTYPITLSQAGTATLPLAAVLSGLSGNLAAGTALSFIAAPAGVQSGATLLGLSGGADNESDPDLLLRILDEIRTPPSGGNIADYKRWAKSVAGVSDAYVFALRRGLGTVDVAVEAAGGIPSDVLIAQVQAYLDIVKPVTANVLVIKPLALTVNVAAMLSLSGISYADAVAKISAVLQTYFAKVQVGEPIYKARLLNLIMSVPGVVNVVLTAPALDVYPKVDNQVVEIAVLGTVTLQ